MFISTPKKYKLVQEGKQKRDKKAKPTRKQK